MTPLHRSLIVPLTIFALATAAIRAQSLAVLEPDPDSGVEGFSELLTAYLARTEKVVDSSMAQTAARAAPVPNIFNMTVSEARRIGQAIGVANFVLIKTGSTRRIGVGRPDYYEAFAAIYVVTTRSGMLSHWSLKSSEGPDTASAVNKLKARAESSAREIIEAIRDAPGPGSDQLPDGFITMPDRDSPEAKGLSFPVPYRRIKPKYTSQAFLYSIHASVEAEVDIASDGTIKNVQFIRWAGYGLEQEVEKAIRTMNWRPAMLGAKPLAMRVLLRYNFEKIEKDEEP